MKIARDELAEGKRKKEFFQLKRGADATGEAIQSHGGKADEA